MRYFDSGVLLKLYFLEPNSSVANRLSSEVFGPVLLTRLHRAEVHSALRLKLGRGEISVDDCDSALSAFKEDQNTGWYSIIEPDWTKVFDRGEQLSASHTSATLCRTLDTLHVAIALELGATEFCTFDKRQAAMARLVGLNVVP